MKAIELIFVILTVSFGISSCMMSSDTVNASKETEKRVYHLSSISNITASTDVNIIISPGYTEDAITAKGSKNVWDALILRNDSNGQLSISLAHGERFKYNSENQKAHIYNIR